MPLDPAVEQQIEQVRQNAARAAKIGAISWAEADRLVTQAYERENAPDATYATSEDASEDDVQFCSYCSEPFPGDDPMLDYDGQTFCSPNCVRDMLADDDCDHACYVAAVNSFNARLGRILTADAKAPDA